MLTSSNSAIKSTKRRETSSLDRRQWN